MKDCIPKRNLNNNPFNEDLKIIDFVFYKFRYKCNVYHVPIYILTDKLPGLLFGLDIRDGYETMIRVGFIDNCEFLCYQERCLSKLESYKQHKSAYKKLLNGFFDNEILRIIEKGGFCNNMNCR